MLLVCYQCGYQSKHKSNFKDHMKVHIRERTAGLGGIEPWELRSATLPNMKPRKTGNYDSASSVCESFDYESERVGGTKNYMATEKKSYKCGACDYKTRKASNLSAHLKLHGNETRSMRTHAVKKTLDCQEFPFRCMANSMVHKRPHFSERPHCSVCDCNRFDGFLHLLRRMSGRLSGKKCCTCYLSGYSLNQPESFSKVKSYKSLASCECCCNQSCCKKTCTRLCDYSCYRGCRETCTRDPHECALSGDLKRLMITLSGEKPAFGCDCRCNSQLSKDCTITKEHPIFDYLYPNLPAGHVVNAIMQPLEQAAVGSSTSTLVRSREDVNFESTEQPKQDIENAI